MGKASKRLEEWRFAFASFCEAEPGTSAEVFLQSFADLTVVSQFCEALYFQEATTK